MGVNALRAAAACALAAIATAALAAEAAAFDVGAHTDMTRDAFFAERYHPDHAYIAQVNSFLVDLYENAEKNPLSGHWSDWADFPFAEHWPEASWRSADALHFDSTGAGYPETKQLSDARALQDEWIRLNRATTAQALEAAKDGSYARYFTVLGISLHAVQDFYSHTNWVEPVNTPGYDGPGWAQRGYGTVPTWMDISPSVRQRTKLYAAGAQGAPRPHGRWHTDGNQNLAHGANKDWEGRPYYREAYWAAYFHSRAWIRTLEKAVRSRYPVFARGLRKYRVTGAAREELGRDVSASRVLLFFIGHWHGQGDNQGGDPAAGEVAEGRGYAMEDLATASVGYFGAKTAWRQAFEDLAPLIASPVYRKAQYPTMGIGGTRSIQEGRRFVRLSVRQIRAVDPNIDATDGADFFVQARLGTQFFFSSMIRGADVFGFEAPYAPFTFIKSVGRGAQWRTPLYTLRVRIQTADKFAAGTDDDVYLRINDNVRWLLDREDHSDFEVGTNDWYSVSLDRGDSGACPIGGTGCPHHLGLTLDDIDYIQIEKEPDGIYGGWKLAGVEVEVNGETLMAAAPNRWLEDDDRTWRWPGKPYSSPQLTKALPVHIGMTDVDGGFKGDHDVVDLSPWGNNYAVGDPYVLGTSPWVFTSGDDVDNPHHDDDDEGEIFYTLATDTVVPPKK